jgi:hypothetical protein
MTSPAGLGDSVIPIGPATFTPIETGSPACPELTRTMVVVEVAWGGTVVVVGAVGGGVVVVVEASCIG